MIVFGTRGSRLAMAQTRHVAAMLQARTGEEWRLEVIETRGDRITDVPLPAIGGKGLFTAELEQALREGRIDAAVHSLKDLPVEDAEGLVLGAIPERADPRDVLVLDPAQEDPEGGTVPLLGGAVVGTSSPRRRTALRCLRPDLRLVDLRGNVPTRADKVRQGKMHACVLAAAGLDRLQLDLEGLQRLPLPPERCTPAPGQGALAVQCRAGDARVRGLLATIHDADVRACVDAERALLAELGGGCSMPLGALAAKDHERGGHRFLATLYSSAARTPAAVSLERRGADLAALVAEAAALLRPLVGEPLAGRRLLLLRPGGEGGELAATLRVAGADVHLAALTQVEPLPVAAGAFAAVPRGAALAFTSARAVDAFFERAAGEGLPVGEFRCFAVGPATADAVRHRGLDCRAPEPASTGTALAELLLEALPPETTIVFPCAENRRPELERRLGEAGRTVVPLPLYRTVPLEGVQLPEGPFDFVLVTSPSAVAALRAQPALPAGKLLALGPTTAAAMTAADLPLSGAAATPDAASLLLLMREEST